MLDYALLHRFLSAPLDPDVKAWALGCIIAQLTPAERRAERDRWIRTAGALVPGAGWTRARALHGLAGELAAALPAMPDVSTARGCVAAALLIAPGRMPSLKTFGRALAGIGLHWPRTRDPASVDGNTDSQSHP